MSTMLQFEHLYNNPHPTIPIPGYLRATFHVHHSSVAVIRVLKSILSVVSLKICRKWSGFSQFGPWNATSKKEESIQHKYGNPNCQIVFVSTPSLFISWEDNTKICYSKQYITIQLHYNTIKIQVQYNDNLYNTNTNTNTNTIQLEYNINSLNIQCIYIYISTVCYPTLEFSPPSRPAAGTTGIVPCITNQTKVNIKKRNANNSFKKPAFLGNRMQF